MASKKDFVAVIEAMHEAFRVQHSHIIYEQTKVLDDYKEYFNEILARLEQHKLDVLGEETDLAKEISELGDLLSEAVKTCSQEIPGIISQLASLQEGTEE